MVKLLELIVELQRIIKDLEQELRKELQKRSITLSVQEVICIFQSIENPTLKKVSQSSAYSYDHLLFNLYRLEKQEMLQLVASSPTTKDYKIILNEKSGKIFNIISKIKVSNENLKVITNLYDKIQISSSH